MWQRLVKKLVVKEPRGKPFRGSSLDDLREFEQRHDFTFPRSYCAFAVDVGAGLFCNYFRVFTPGFELEDQLQTRGLDLFKEVYGDSPFIDRMMPFGSTIGGDVIVWDPDEITSPRNKEYAIYVLTRDYGKIVRLCSDFKTFVNDCCFGHQFSITVDGAPDPEWVIEYVMQRFRPSRRKDRHNQSRQGAKKATKKTSVKKKAATKKSNTKPKRFELVGGSSSKFWSIELHGDAHTVQFGRIGTNGQKKTKSFQSEEKAQASYEKLIAEKLAKGYVEKRVKSAANAATTRKTVTRKHK